MYRAIAVATGALLAWCIACQMLLSAGVRVDIAQNPRVSNLMAIEKLALRRTSPTVLVVGSSLTSRLVGADQDNSGDYYALGLAGNSPITGLLAVSKMMEQKRLGRLKAVYVEVNVLEGNVDPELIDNVFGWPMLDLRSMIAGLRYEYEPMNLLFLGLNRLKGHAGSDPGLPVDDPRSRTNAVAKAAETERGQKPASEFLPALHGLVDKLRASGIAVNFIVVPTHPIIERTKAQTTLIATVRNSFSCCRIFMLKTAEPIRLVDGFHLSMASGAQARDLILKLNPN